MGTGNITRGLHSLYSSSNDVREITLRMRWTALTACIRDKE
jgi:hypothetical protein